MIRKDAAKSTGVYYCTREICDKGVAKWLCGGWGMWRVHVEDDPP